MWVERDSDPCAVISHWKVKRGLYNDVVSTHVIFFVLNVINMKLDSLCTADKKFPGYHHVYTNMKNKTLRLQHYIFDDF